MLHIGLLVQKYNAELTGSYSLIKKGTCCVEQQYLLIWWCLLYFYEFRKFETVKI